MLTNLYIENIAIIEKVSIDFDAGLLVFTGETGAGKSIIIDAINAILGERTSKELIRTGAKNAHISALFSDILPVVQEKLRELDLPPEEDDTLLLQRSITADGKTNCKINGRPATVSMLKEISKSLINIHGQHDSGALLLPEHHMGYIDSKGDYAVLLAEYREAYTGLMGLKRQIAKLSMDETERLQRIERLEYQIQELSDAQIQIGETEELQQQKQIYLNAERIIEGLDTAYSALHGSDESSGAMELLSDAMHAIQEVSRYLESLTELSEQIQDVYYRVEDYTSQIGDSFSEFEYDAKDLEDLEARLDLLYRLGRKYGGSEEEMLAFLENAVAELETLEHSAQTAEALTAQLKVQEEKTAELAQALSEKRRICAEDFAQKVCAELQYLDMPNVRFTVLQEKVPYHTNGIDRMEFLISANKGEVPKPLSKIASGGELSRIMLAIKSILADEEPVSTLIFDEIDTGVSGKAAQKIGFKLKAVSKGRQVICVTHLAQIAALADSHYLIAKKVQEDKTYTSVSPLDFEGRKHELARIMGGMTITELLLQNAEEMLKQGASSA